jgi:hypothetical protein
MLLIVWLTFLF